MLRKLAAFLLLGLLACAVPQGTAQADALQDWIARTEWDWLKVSGDIGIVQSSRLYSPGNVTSRIDAHLKLQFNFDWVNGEVVFKGEKNWKVEELSGVSVHEAWLEHAGEIWDIRVGRQILVWGKADGLRVTDNICPTDYREVIVRDLADARIPVNAARIRLLLDSIIAEVIWLPGFQPAELPTTSDNPWNIMDKNTVPFRYKGSDKPDYFNVRDSELAFRLSAYTSGFDISLSAFYTWDDFPNFKYGYERTANGYRATLKEKHYRVGIFGLDCSYPWKDFVFRGEAAYFYGKHNTRKDVGEPLRGDQVRALIGVDWQPGDDWMVTAQLYDQWITQYDHKMSADPHQTYATLNISKQFLNQTLKVSNMTYLDLAYGEFFNRFQVEYSFTDNLKGTLAWDQFDGTRQKLLGQYYGNSQVWCKLKYSF